MDEDNKIESEDIEERMASVFPRNDGNDSNSINEEDNEDSEGDEKEGDDE